MTRIGVRCEHFPRLARADCSPRRCNPAGHEALFGIPLVTFTCNECPASHSSSFFFLAPADQDAAIAVPLSATSGLLQRPASRFPAGRAGLQLDLLAAGPDVRQVAVLAGETVHRGRVVAAVETEPLRPLRCRLGPLDRDAVQRGREEGLVLPVGSRRVPTRRGVSDLLCKQGLTWAGSPDGG